MRNFNDLTRRDLVKMFGFAGVMATPLLRQTRAFAADSMQPIYIQLFKPNGNPHDSYYADPGNGFSFTRKDCITKSFEAVKEYIISPEEIHIYKDGGNSHSEGMVRNFSNSTSVDEIHNAKNYKACLEPSIDQMIADHLYARDPSRIRHLHWQYSNRLSYSGHPLDTTSFKLSPGANRTQPQYPETDLQKMFDSLIGRFTGCNNGAPTNNSGQNPRLSVLDYNLEQIKDLKRKLDFSTTEKAKLEEFENQIQIIQNNILRLKDTGNTCPEFLTNQNTNLNESYERARVFMDLMVLAIEWELTHVASFQFGSAQDFLRYGYLDLEDDSNFHSLSHEGRPPFHGLSTNELGPGTRSFSKVCEFQFDNFGYLLKQLKDKKTINDKNLLDIHLALISGGEVSMTEDAAHRHDKMPFFIAGKANGAWDTGYKFSLPTYSRNSNDKSNAHGRLLLSVCHAMGLTHLTHVGDQDKCPGGPMIAVR